MIAIAVELSLGDLALIALLLVLNAAASIALRLGLGRKLLVASTRAVVQLTVLGFILKAVFDRKDLKARKQRIERVVNGEATGKAAKEVVQAVQAAVLVTTCIVPIIVT